MGTSLHIGAVLLCLSGCGKTLVVPYATKTPIYFSDIAEDDSGDKTVGYCVAPQMPWAAIYIDRTWFGAAPDILKNALIMHESGHCDYGLEHDDHLMDNECPMTIMNTHLPSQACLEMYTDYYQKEYEMKIYHSITTRKSLR